MRPSSNRALRPKQKTTLVTGGAGFIGSNLCTFLLKKGFTVYAADNFITGSRANLVPLTQHPQFHFSKIDITSPKFLKKFSNVPIDQIYHLACPTGVPNIQKLSEEMLRTSSVGTWNVLELARKHRSRVLFTSTAEVYGDPLACPQDETYTGNVNPIGPRSPYEEGKRFAEALSVMYARKYGLHVKIVRVFNTYGPRMSPRDQRVIPCFLRAATNGEPLCVYGDGSQTRTLLYVDDLIRGLWLVTQKGKVGDVYNVGGETQVPIKKLARKVLALNGYGHGLTFSPHFIQDHKKRQPALTKIKKLGWRQTISLDHGLRRMMKYIEYPLSSPHGSKSQEAAPAIKVGKLLR